MAVRMQHHLGSVLGELRFEPVRTRLRASLGGQAVLDTTAAVLVWEPRRVVPMYAVPVTDLDARVEPVEPQPPAPELDRLPPVLGPERFEPHTAAGIVADVVVGTRRLPRAAYLLDDPTLEGRAVVDFDAFEEWRSEEEPLVSHPRDPFKRIDVLTSSRHVRVSLDGVLLAETRRSLMLFETPLPLARHYLPLEDVRMDLLVPSPATTSCAYKGTRLVLLHRRRCRGGSRPRLDLPAAPRRRAAGP